MDWNEAEALVIADVRESHPDMTKSEALQHAFDTVDPSSIYGDDPVATAYRLLLIASQEAPFSVETLIKYRPGTFNAFGYPYWTLYHLAYAFVGGATMGRQPRPSDVAEWCTSWAMMPDDTRPSLWEAVPKWLAGFEEQAGTESRRDAETS